MIKQISGGLKSVGPHKALKTASNCNTTAVITGLTEEEKTEVKELFLCIENFEKAPSQRSTYLHNKPKIKQAAAGIQYL